MAEPTAPRCRLAVTALTFLLLTIHIVVGAVWLGAMAYSLAVLQPRLRRFFGDPARPRNSRHSWRAGARWKVIAMIGLLAASGGGLLAVEGWQHPTAWRLAVVAKAALLVVAAAFFCWVSWRLWPARVFALPAEVPRWQRRFDLVGAVLIGLVGAQFVLGAAASRSELAIAGPRCRDRRAGRASRSADASPSGTW